MSTQTVDVERLAQKVGVSRFYMSQILRGERTPGKDLAKSLEDATGVTRLCWLYPEEYANPLLQKNGPQAAAVGG